MLFNRAEVVTRDRAPVPCPAAPFVVWEGAAGAPAARGGGQRREEPTTGEHKGSKRPEAGGGRRRGLGEASASRVNVRRGRLAEA
jgi:hypothetical protein